MRKRLLASIALLTTLAAPQALACRREASAPPPPQVFWSAPPEQILSGESVVEVEFVRGIFQRDRENPDIIIVPSCGPMDDLYRVKRVLAGDGLPDDFLIISDSHADPERDRALILVGRLIPQAPISPDARHVPDVDPAIPRLHPRLPPQ